MEVCQENSYLFKICQKCQALYLNTEECFIVASDINRHKSAVFEMKWYQSLRIAVEV